MLRWKSDFIFRLQNNSKSLRYDEYRRGVQMLLSIGNVERFYLILRNTWDFDTPFYKNIYSESFLKQQEIEQFKVHKEFDKIFESVHHQNGLDQVLYAEFQSKMVNDYLLTDDRMSMAHSVEERIPFLDRDLVDFGFTLPVEMKIKNNQSHETISSPQDYHEKEMGIHSEPVSTIQKGFKRYSRKDSYKRIYRETGDIQL